MYIYIINNIICNVYIHTYIYIYTEKKEKNEEGIYRNILNMGLL